MSPSSIRQERHVRRSDSCGCGQLRDGDVIRMAVGAVGTEGEDDVGADRSQFPDDAADRISRVRPIEFLVLEPEDAYVANAENGGRGAQFTLADLRERLRTRMFAVSGTMSPEATAIAPR